jgi:hypothetical protein
MGRLSVLLGTVLVIAAIGVMTLTGTVETYAFSANLVADYLCEADERITTEQRVVQQATVGTTTFYYCEDIEGVRREINAELRQVTAIGFMAPFVPGILLMMYGVWAVRRERARSQIVPYPGKAKNSDVYTITGGSTINLSQTNMSPQQQAQVEQILQSVASAFGAFDGDTTLAERLKEVEDAYQQGLISTEEYERVRQAILDRADDR